MSQGTGWARGRGVTCKVAARAASPLPVAASAATCGKRENKAATAETYAGKAVAAKRLPRQPATWRWCVL
jgi:hypothetical protein